MSRLKASLLLNPGARPALLLAVDSDSGAKKKTLEPEPRTPQWQVVYQLILELDMSRSSPVSAIYECCSAVMPYRTFGWTCKPETVTVVSNQRRCLYTFQLTIILLRGLTLQLPWRQPREYGLRMNIVMW